MQGTNRRCLVAGNWKLNGSKQLVNDILDKFKMENLDHLEVVVCPPFPYLGLFDGSMALGAQNLSEFESGPHTGEVSGEMLLESGCQYVIVGHSERRSDNGETNQLVALKAAKALQAGLTPILCVGEPEEIREKGDLFNYIALQLDAVISHVGIEKFNNVVLAYEPIWAIGTGKTASPEQAQEVHLFIREHLAKQNADIAEKVTILYGGSVNSGNAKELFSQKDVDGGLIGGASLDPDDFLSICLAAKQ